MPHVHDGIGTWYYGKRNVQGRTGICEFCGNPGRLLSYETRLWFVVFFIPLIPLAKKQILDDCPRCRRHRASPLKKWKQVEAHTLLKAMQHAEANPHDSAAAIALHGAMVAFKRREEAGRLAEVMARDFPDNFDVQMHLGRWYAFDGALQKSRACIAKALEIKPDDPAAKRMAALGCIDDGDLDRAGELLRGMDSPGPDQAPDALCVLAGAYLNRGDHAKALALYNTVLQMTPALAQDKQLRKRIKTCEKALGQTKTSLPKLKRSYGKLYALLAVAAAAILGVLAWNFYQSKHQTLYIVNQLHAPVSVRIDEDPACEVPDHSRRRVSLAEGDHHALIQQQGKPDEALDFRMHNGFFQRFSGRTVFVLNAGGAADLLWEEIAYAPVGGPKPRDQLHPYRIHFGQKFYAIPNVDYPFQQAPRQLTTDKNAKQMTKTQLSVLDFDPGMVLGNFPQGAPPEELASYAEYHLKLTPGNDNLLQLYLLLMVYSKQTDRCREFLAGGLDKRPVLIEWHRTYQNICLMTGREDAVVSEYQKLLGAEPGDSALLYLLGRVIADPKKAQLYYRQAIQADPKNAYPYFATAFHLVASGDFQGAKDLAQKACQLKPDHSSMTELLYDIRFALEEYDKLQQQLREQQSQQPLNFGIQRSLLQVLTAAGLRAAAQQAHEAYAQQVAQASPGDPQQLVLGSQMSLAYLSGDMDGFLAGSAASKQSAGGADESFAANIELGRPQEAEEALATGAPASSPTTALIMSLAWSQKGEGQKAADWRKKAIDALRAGDYNEKLAAALLEKKDYQPGQLDDVILPHKIKAAVAGGHGRRLPRQTHGTSAIRGKTQYRYLLPPSVLKERHSRHAVISPLSAYGDCFRLPGQIKHERY